MDFTANRISINIQDLITGILFTILGGGAAYGSSFYSGISGIFPGMIGSVIVILGCILILRSISRPATEIVIRQNIPPLFLLFLTIAISIIYIAMVASIGFYTSSTLLMIVMPLVFGFRRIIPLVIGTLLFMVCIYGVFSVFLARHLPRDLLFFILN